MENHGRQRSERALKKKKITLRVNRLLPLYNLYLEGCYLFLSDYCIIKTITISTPESNFPYMIWNHQCYTNCCEWVGLTSTFPTTFFFCRKVHFWYVLQSKGFSLLWYIFHNIKQSHLWVLINNKLVIIYLTSSMLQKS